VEGGYCVSYFESSDGGLIYGGCNFVIFFLFPLAIFIYCYGRMVVVIRKQMRIMAAHSVEGSATNAAQAQSKRWAVCILAYIYG